MPPYISGRHWPAFSRSRTALQLEFFSVRRKQAGREAGWPAVPRCPQVSSDNLGFEDCACQPAGPPFAGSSQIPGTWFGSTCALFSTEPKASSSPPRWLVPPLVLSVHCRCRCEMPGLAHGSHEAMSYIAPANRRRRRQPGPDSNAFFDLLGARSLQISAAGGSDGCFHRVRSRRRSSSRRMDLR